jgi:hypothetical protein
MNTLNFKTAILSYIATIFSFFTPLAPFLILVFFAVVADTFVGRWYARQKGILITSKLTREGFTTKMISYGMGLVFIYCLDVWILNSVILMYFPKEHLSTSLTALFLIWIEYSSIDEKIRWIKGKGITEKLFDFVSKIKKIIKIIVSSKKGIIE